MGISAPTLSGLVDRLTRREFVERLSDPSDRRVVRVRLTPEGERVSHDYESTAKVLLAQVFRRMGARGTRRFARDMRNFAEAFRWGGEGAEQLVGKEKPSRKGQN